jgi:DNA-binding CsgD family transcriptional regulator
VIRGEAGIGKTALLDYARSRCAPASTLIARGIELEAGIPYVGLADLVRPVADRLARLPERQCATLSGVLGLEPPVTADRFAVAAATVNLLGVLADDAPLLVVVDDLQWLDRASVEALWFAGRRLAAEGVAMILAERTHERGIPLSGLDEIRLDGLDVASAEALIDERGAPGLGGALRRQLIEETRGNPLALIELSQRTELGERTLWARGVAPLPTGAALADGFGRAVRALPDETRQALVLLAVLGSVPPWVHGQALARLGLGVEVLDPAGDAGLVVLDGLGAAFTHPLVRAAAHGIATAGQRRRAHRAAAAVLAGSTAPNALERRAWHELAAGTAPTSDGELAGLVLRAAEEESGRTNFAIAGYLYRLLAELVPDDPRAVTWLVRAADGTRLSGGIEEAMALLRRALDCTTDAAARTGIEYSIHRVEMWRDTTAERCVGLVALADRTADPLLAALMLTDAAVAGADLDDPAVAMRLSERAVQRCGPGPVPLPVEVVHALLNTLHGRPGPCVELLTSLGSAATELDALGTELLHQLMLVVGMCQLSVEQTAAALEAVTQATEAARAADAVGILPFRLIRLAWIEYWSGDWTAALSHAHDGIRLAEDIGWASQVPVGLATLARVEAGLGLERECRLHASLARSTGSASAMRVCVAMADAALGLLELGRGEHQAAINHLETVARYCAQVDIVDTPLLSWSGDLVEALVRAGRRADAQAAADRLGRSSDGAGPTVRAVLARCRALLEPDRAEDHLRAAMAIHGEGGSPFERARTQLQFAEHLRRRRRRGAAHDLLTAADTTFRRLGAVDWSTRARSELRATGDRSVPAPQHSLSRVLTPQELQVSLAAGRGLSNRDVAAQLFLSVKTVEYHLGNTYRKLQIRGRPDLIRMVCNDDEGG